MKIYRLLLPFLMIICLHSSAQSNSDQAKQSSYQKLKHGIDSKQFHFLATSATTAKGKTVQLNPGYFIFIGGDSLTVALPFFGTDNQSSHYGASRKMQELTSVLISSPIRPIPQKRRLGYYLTTAGPEISEQNIFIHNLFGGLQDQYKQQRTVEHYILWKCPFEF